MRLCALINSCSPRSDPVIVLISRWRKWGAEKLSKLPRVTQPALAMEEPWLPGSTGPRVKSEEVCTDGTSTAGECCQGADWGDVLALGQDPSPCHGGGVEKLQRPQIWTKKFPSTQRRTGVLPWAHQQHRAGEWGLQRGGWGWT